MNKRTKRILKQMIGLFLAIAIVLSYTLSASSDRVLMATELPEETEEEITLEEEGLDEETVEIPLVTEDESEETSEEEAPAEVQEELENAEIPEDSDEAVAQEAEEEPETSTEDEISDEEVSDGENSVEEVPSKEVSSEEEIAESVEETHYPAQELTASAADGTSVVITAPEGALPEGSYVRITALGVEGVTETVEDLLDEETDLVDLVAYDITIYGPDDAEIQPDESVRVQIVGADIEAGDSASIFHITDDGVAEKVGNVTDTENVIFEASGFSTYVVASTSTNETLTMQVGDTMQFNVPSSYNRYTVQWKSGNTAVATIGTSTGLATAVKAGQTTITLEYRSGWSYKTALTYSLTVTEAPKEPGITLNLQSLRLTSLGQTQTLIASLSMMDADNTVVWASSDPSVVTVSGGVVTAVGAGSATVTASVSPEEDELYGETFTASATVQVEFSSYDVYHYALIPGADADDTSGSADSRWYGLGVSKIVGVPAPTSLSQGTTLYDYQMGEVVKTLYPDLDYQGVTYRYAEPGSAEAETYGYYTLQPFRVTVAAGANAGSNSYNPYVGGGNTYHLDYTCIINEKNFYSVNFAVQYPQSHKTQALTDYAQRVKDGTSLGRITKPSSGAVPETMTASGVTYRFDGWYLDENYTQPADFSGTVVANTLFYGRYVATNAKYRIEYYYDGVLDESLTDFMPAQTIGDEVSGYTNKTKTGFTLSEVTPEALTIAADERTNVIRVFYTKRLLSYQVGYYLNGTDERIAPAQVKSAKYGETGTGEAKEIEGYTLASDKTEQELTLTGAGLEIRFDYYKNTELTAENAVLTYNGEKQQVSGLSCPDPDADFTAISATGEGKDTGVYTVRFDESAVGTVDATGRYLVTAAHEGHLTIIPRKITLTSGSASAEYDGAALKADAVTVSGDGFATGEGASYTVTGAQRIVGSSENAFTYTLNEGTLDANYEITVEYGTLTVTARAAKFEVILTAKSDEILYDGLPHAVEGFTGENALTVQVKGHTYQIEGLEARAEATNAGVYPVEITGEAKVLDEDGQDVTAEFLVQRLPGTLTVEKRQLTLTSDSASKEYDGSALRAEKIEVSGDGFAEGEGATYRFLAEQTLVGFADNTFEYTLNAGTDASNYDIEVIPGTLTVLNRDTRYAIVVSAKHETCLYDGQEHTVEGLTTTRFGIGEQVYTVSGLEAGTTALHAGSYPVRITGTPVVTDAGGNDVTEQFAITTQEGSLTIAPRTLKLRSKDASKTYDGTPVTQEDIVISGDGLADGDQIAFEVTGSRLQPGMAENRFEYAFVEGTEASDYAVETMYGQLQVLGRPEDALFEVHVKANGAEYLYDGEEHEVSGWTGAEVTANAEDGAVLEIEGQTYVLSGVEAQQSAVQAGTYAVNFVGTPYITDAEGVDVTDQFLVHAENETLRIRPREVVLTSGSASHAYNGRVLANQEVSISGDGFAEGEGAEFEVTGGRTLVGISENIFTYALQEETDAANYVITQIYGTLNVTNRDARYQLTVTANSADYLYDGEEKQVEGLVSNRFNLDDVEYTIEGLEAYVSAQDAGEYNVPITGTARVLDENGEDVTDQFAVETVSGTLRIRPRQVHLQSESETKPYDGDPLEQEEVTEEGDGFVDGEGVEIETSGEQTLPGSTDNTFRWTPQEGTNEDNYEITEEFGRLNVTNPEATYAITIRANSEEVTYDGEEHTVANFEKTTFTVEGNTYTVEGLEAVATGTEAGVYTSAVRGTPTVLDENQQDVTDQFAIEIDNGTLTVQAEEEPFEVIEETAVPLAAAPLGYWALINLLLVIATAMVTLFLILAFFFGKNKKEEETTKKRSILWPLVSLIPTALATIVFLLTENTTNTMRLFDRWTVWMVVILILQTALCVFGLRKSKEADASGTDNRVLS